MIKQITYSIEDVAPYINWPYFDYAWGVGSKGRDEREALRRDAAAVLDGFRGRYDTHAVFGLFDANSDGDDIIAGGVRIPMLRQQHPHPAGAPCLCLADFLRPVCAGVKDKIGVFVATVDPAMEKDCCDDPYHRMMVQTLADRLAEATAEKMHESVRRVYWGYAPDENLSMQQLHIEAFQGIRPAVGYPSLPDTSINFIISDMLCARDIGVRLTESGMMIPHASVSGFMFSHPKARYFDIGRIGEDQLKDYAVRRGIPVEMVRRFLGNF